MVVSKLTFHHRDMAAIEQISPRLQIITLIFSTSDRSHFSTFIAISIQPSEKRIFAGRWLREDVLNHRLALFLRLSIVVTSLGILGQNICFGENSVNE